MNEVNSILHIEEICIHVVRKNVKNINFSIRTLDGRVRVSVPKRISNHELQIAISSRLDWIRNKIQVIKNRPKKIIKLYQSGEEIKYLDQQYTLKVIEQSGLPHIVERDSAILEMHISSDYSIKSREKLLYEWYRCKLKRQIPILIKKWQPVIGKSVSSWGIKRMKTRWGSCNINKNRIWLNLELAKQPEACLEYVVVHEMTHLLERNHNTHFKKLLDEFIPDWRRIEEQLNPSVR